MLPFRAGEYPTRQQLGQCVAEVDVISHPRLVKVNLCEHKISSNDKALGGVVSTLIDSEPEAAFLVSSDQFHRIDELTPVKFPIVNTRVNRIPDQVIDSIRI